MASKPPTTKYQGSVYIGIVGPDGEYGSCRDSIEGIARRPEDSPLMFLRATKGYEARQTHINNFLEMHHDFILMLDQDQVFPPDTLERLRAHGLPYVSGFYMRRNYEALGPVWYRPFTGRWPMMPWVGPVERGKLHELGASGWGCILMHRNVVLGVRALLRGEWEVLEDDMDVWPYNLVRIMDAIRGLEAIADKPHPVAVKAFVDVLKEEIRPLRCDRDIVGSDIRFPFFAKQAGFTLYGDPDVSCGHMVDYPLSINDYNAFTAEQLQNLNKRQTKFVNQLRRQIDRQKAEVLGE